MPPELLFFDGDVTTEPPAGRSEPVPITLGATWQPHDIRLLFWTASDFYYSGAGGSTPIYYDPNPFPPAGFTTGYDPFPTTGHWLAGTWRRLQVTDQDNLTINWFGNFWAYYVKATISVRGVSRATNPTWAEHTFSQLTGPNRIRLSSRTIPSAGWLVLYVSAVKGDDVETVPNSPNPSSYPFPSSGSSLGVPTGWTHLAASPRSGKDFYAWDNNNNGLLIAKKYTASGSTGTIDVPTAYLDDGWAEIWFRAISVFLVAAPDTVVSEPAPTANSMGAGTAEVQSTGLTPTCTEPDAEPNISGGGNQDYNPCHGYRISKSLPLPGDEIKSSMVAWDATVPAGTELTVETSINYMMSWDVCTNGGPIPRLPVGDTSVRQIFTRVTMKRPDTTYTKPKIHILRVRPHTDSGRWEWIPIGHGIIDKPQSKITSGASGGSSGSSVSGAGVKSRGGGASGGGRGIIKIKALDPSAQMDEAGWEQPFIVPVDTNYVSAAISMAKNRMPWLSDDMIVATPTDRTIKDTPLFYGMTDQQKPWTDMKELLMSIGYWCYFGPDGKLYIKPIADPRYTAPVWKLSVAARDFFEAESELSPEMIKNRIVVTGASNQSDNPITVMVQDDNPTSDVSIHGRLGIRTQRVTFPWITDEEQAYTAAWGILSTSLGLAETVTVLIHPVYVLEPGDAVMLEVPELGIAGVYIVTSMNTGLSPGDPQELVLFRQSIFGLN